MPGVPKPKEITSWAKRLVVTHLLSYDQTDLLKFLNKIGVTSGDSLMVHSSWRALNGFKGTPSQFGHALRDAVGEGGLLVMPSLTYHNMSSADFLANGKPMDVKRSPSAMGLLTEVFRRGRGVLRSLSPTHPLLAWGRDASAFISGHELTDHPFGPQSPFARLLERNAMILCMDTSFASVTFSHFVEDRLSGTIGVPLYEPAPMVGTVIDANGARIDCPTRVISAQANQLRREQRLVDYLTRNGMLHRKRIGNTQMLWIRAADLVNGAEALVHNGGHFFADPGESRPSSEA